MAAAPEIQYIQSIRKFQLVLPESMIETFQLRDDSGNPLSITHENKMELEWLAQKLNTLFKSQSETTNTFQSKLNTKRKMAFIVLAIAILIVVFSHSLSTLLGSAQLPISGTGFALGVIAILQLLKYFAQKLSGPVSKLADAEEVLKIKETILKNFV